MREMLPRTSIVDYGMGNLFSVARACEVAGLDATVTANARELTNADAVILPGVGAFGDAMSTLRKLDLVQPLKDIALSGKPLFGICLGMQLLMTESTEFGHHQGLDLVPGIVRRFEAPAEQRGITKVPQVGWNTIHPSDGSCAQAWQGTPLEGVSAGEYMYFVHSYHAEPVERSVVLSSTVYEGISFCSSLRRGNIFACQFHPERSGEAGLRLYRNFASQIRNAVERSHQ